MKRKVLFREYTLPEVDEETGQSERGDFLGSFHEVIEGATLLEISERADARSKQLSHESGNDVRVFEIPVF